MKEPEKVRPSQWRLINEEREAWAEYYRTMSERMVEEILTVLKPE